LLSQNTCFKSAAVDAKRLLVSANGERSRLDSSIIQLLLFQLQTSCAAVSANSATNRTPQSCDERINGSKASSMKKALRETQTLRATNFRPTADPLPGGAGPPKFNQLEMFTTCTYKPSLVKIDPRNFELSW